MFRPVIAALTLTTVLAIPGTVTAQTPAQNDSAAARAKRTKTLPLITTRTMSFTTDEGSWISLDVSPDGSTIVFELLGDLYTLPIAGGEAIRIAEGQPYDMQPRYSPDGSKIVFVSDRTGSENVWIMNADGGDPRALTTGERESYMSPVWTPDGQYVISGKGTQLWLYHTQGGSGAQITGHAPEDGGTPPGHQGPAFGNDGRYLWVNLRGNLGGGIQTGLHGLESPTASPTPALRSSLRQVGAFQIGRLDRETGRMQVRTHELEGAFRPMPTPDGRSLVYATRYDDREALKLLDLATGEERWLVMDVQRDDHQGGGSRDRDVYPGSAFTPDSESLITSYDGKIWSVNLESGDATAIPFSAKVEQELGALAQFEYPINDSTLTVSQIRGARPSPDGSHVVFAALDRLWIADLPDGTREPGGTDDAFPTIRDAQRLTQSTDVEHAPVWSPDGRYVAYVIWNDSTGGDIYRVRADGNGAPERLTEASAFYDKLAYSRDGSRIVAVQGSKMHRMRMLEDFGGHSGAAELSYVWMPSQGGATTQITWVGSGATQEGRNAPHMGPDPDRIYVWAGSDGLLSMRYDGTDIKTIVKVSGPQTPGRGSSSRPATPDEVVLSPNGARALVRVNRNVYMVTVPPVGGTVPTVSVTGSSMPARRLTQIGGDFVGWRQDGEVAHYSIGRSFFQYDVVLADSIIGDSIFIARVEAAEKANEPANDTTDNEDEEESSDESGDDPAADSDAKGGPIYEAARTDIEIIRQKDKPRGVVALRGARLITMDGDEIIARGDIVIRDNRIAAIGAQGTVDIPEGSEVRDFSGKTILPGYVDVHAHTWVAWGLHRRQVSQFMAQLAFGVTTQRDPQTTSEDVLAYSDLMELGELVGPRLYSTGPGIFSADNIKSLDDARDVLRRYSDHFNTQTIKQYMAGDRKVRQWVAMAANELRLTPTTEGGSNFTMNLTLMQDGYGGLEHTLPISPFYGDVVELVRFSGLTYTPTLIVSYGGPSGLQYFLTHEDIDQNVRLQTFTPHDELDKWKTTRFFRTDQYPFRLHAEQLTKVVEAGGRVGLGSHGEVQGLGTHWELWMLGSGGMDLHDLLRAATLHGADALGLSNDLGSLEVGKLADLQILDANPLDDIHNSTSISHVMKNGRLYDADTLTEVWPRQRELPTPWWWRVEPSGNGRGGR